MNDCAIDFPSGDSEVEATGLKTLPSIDIERAATRPRTFRARVPATFHSLSARPRASVGEVLRLQRAQA